MTHPRFVLPPLLSLVAACFLLLGCERDKTKVDETQEYLNDHPVTLDNQTGSVNLTPRPSLSLTPTTATVKQIGDTVIFTAAGGTPPYEWGIGNASNGWLKVLDGNPCIYTCTKLKQNSVYLKDHRDTVLAATITVVSP